MKNLLSMFLILALVSCKKNEEKKEPLYPEDTEVSEGAAANMTSSEKLGQEIFNGKGNCASCHKPDKKIIGPSMQEIAKIYKEKNGDMVTFLKGKGDPIVDPSQYEVMKTNFYITKHFSDAELKALQDYIYSHQ